MELGIVDSIKEQTKKALALQMKILMELGEGVLIEDKTGKIVFANLSAENLLGIKNYEIIGNTFLDFLETKERRKIEAILNPLIRGQSEANSIKFESKLTKKTNQEIDVLVYYSIMKSQETLEGALITLLDISDIKNLTKKIQERSNELIQAEKMASIGILASGVAHELNNPLAFIVSNTDTINEYIESLLEYITAWESLKDEDFRNPDVLDKIKEKKKILSISDIKDDIFNIINSNKRGLNRLSDVINDLRTFSYSHTSDNYVKMKASHPIKIALNLLSYELKSIEVVFDLKGDFLIQGTPKLYQVFLNLLHNGIHAIRETDRKGKIEITLTKTNGNLKINFTDNGIGFTSEEQISKIFDPFYTTKEPGKGTGLGLSIAQRIVDDHGGYMIAESPKDLIGASISVFLPLASNNQMKNKVENI